jgi:hypothetical protein
MPAKKMCQGDPVKQVFTVDERRLEEIADIARDRRNRKSKKHTADERGSEEIAKIAEIAKDCRD